MAKGFQKRIIGILKFIFPVLITLVVLFLLFSKMDARQVLDNIVGANPYLILFTVALSFVIMLVRAQRWKIVLKAAGFSIGLKRSFGLSMAALPFWLIAPSTSGDLVKGLFLKDEFKVSKTVGTVACENVFDLLNLLIFSLIGLAFFFDAFLFVLVMVLSILVLSLFFISRINFRFRFLSRFRFAERLNNVMHSLRTVSHDRNVFLNVGFLTLLSWLLSMLQIYLLFIIVGVKVPVLFSFANIPLAILIGMIPVALGGVGTRDAAIVFLFSGFGTAESLLSAGIIFTVVRYVLLAAAGAFFLAVVKKKGFSRQILR